jgi:hypothetical protein
VEQSYRLPSEYSEVSDNQSIDNIDGKDIDLQTIESLADLDDSNTYKMIGEETPVISSSNAPINTSKVSGSNITQLEENEEEEELIQDNPYNNAIQIWMNRIAEKSHQNINPKYALALKDWAFEIIKEDNGIIDQKVVLKFWNEHQSGLIDNKTIIWDVLCFNLWLKRMLLPSSDK